MKPKSHNKSLHWAIFHIGPLKPVRLVATLQKLYSTSVTDAGDRTYLESTDPRNYFNLQ